MKKLFVLLLVGCAFFTFTSCKKNCTCTAHGVSVTVDLKGSEWGDYKNCKALNKEVKKQTDGVMTCK